MVSVSRSIETSDGKIIGVLGIDLPLANLLEDVTHFNSPAPSYAFAIDAKGELDEVTIPEW